MLFTLKSGVDNHPEASVLQHLTDITKKGGVIYPSTDLLVSEHSEGGLYVDMSAGDCIVKKTTAYPIRSTATEVISIDANSSGNPRITAVVIYVDTTATPASDGEGADVVVVGTVNGTPGASPVAPTDSEIQSAIGANNPFIRRANITVASGATGISNANITNIGNRVYLHSPSPRNPITYASTITPDFSLSNKHYCILTGEVTVNAPTNMEVGDFIELELIQDGTGGRTPTWFSGITWLSSDYTANEDSNKHSVYVFEKTGSSTYNGYLAGKEY